MINLLVRVAQEKVGCDFDYPGAIKLLQDCIPDLPIALCNGIITGTHTMTWDGVNVDVKEISNPDALDILELIRVKHDSIEDLYTGNENDDSITYIIQEIRRKFNNLCIDLPLEKWKLLKDGNVDWIKEESDTVWRYEILNKDLIRDIEILNNILVVLQILYPNNKIKEDILSLLHWLEDMYNTLNRGLAKELDIYSHVDEYIKNTISLDKLKIIKPTSEFRTAGWISPDGYYYGLDGTVANQLHIRISDLLIDSNVIPKHPELKPDRWMEENGWMKQHDNKLLYSGYFYKIPVTKEQMLTAKNILLQKYTQAELQDKLIPVNKLLEIDDIQLRKHFS